MNQQQIRVVEECSALSKAGKASFGEIVGKLIEVGVERYHADYTRMETTYYLPDGTSHVVPITLESSPIAQAFSASAVESSVRQAQRGEVLYPQFVQQTCAAGCVGYFVQITGKRVQYFGRDGDVHTEWFPGAKK